MPEKKLKAQVQWIDQAQVKITFYVVYGVFFGLTVALVLIGKLLMTLPLTYWEVGT